MDVPLPMETLSYLEDRFHARYHLKFGNDQEPAASLVSRLLKQPTRRSLQVKEMYTLESLAMTQRAKDKEKDNDVQQQQRRYYY